MSAAAKTSESKAYLLEQVPKKTGVYLFRDSGGEILYIGKAKELKNRVRSYFTPDDSRRFARLLQPQINRVEWIVTDNEKEALILEDSLIKQHQPRYNIDLRDDKSFVSIVITAGDRFPRVRIARSRAGPEKGGIVFGPYPSADSARETLKLVRRVFPFRTCSNNQFRNRARPCLDHQIGLCPAPCTQKVTATEYEEIISEIKLLLSGKGNELIGRLQAEMREASRSLDYERAASLRDRIQALESVLIRQRLVSSRPEDRDLIGLYREGERAALVVLSVREGKLLRSFPFAFKEIKLETPEILASFISQFYQPPREIPPELILPGAPEDSPVLEEVLSERSGSRVKIRVLQKPPRKSLSRMAQENARVYFLTRFSRGGDSLQAVKDALRLPRLPHRIEAFDLSHLGGSGPVGASVYFLDGEPEKSGYRRYRIKSAPGQDDLAMLYEIVSRRYRRIREEKGELPDLILIDGGRGQLNSAQRAFADLDLLPPPMAALAKGRKDKREEGIYLPGRKNPLRLKPRSPALRLLDRIRDEVHRFAITYQKKQRRAALSSELDSIPGIGPARRQALLRHFGSVEKIKKAPVDELARVPGIGRKQAEKLFKQIQRSKPPSTPPAAGLGSSK